MNILVTGSAGFIGFHLSNKLISLGHNVTGCDSINSYYDTKLKYDRIKILKNSNSRGKFKFHKMDLSNKTLFDKYLNNKKFDLICHMAAQAGVRYSFQNPDSYIKNNILAFQNLIDFSKDKGISKIIFASTSSIYGSQKKTPFKETFSTDTPKQFYAITKKTNELMASLYANEYKIEIIGLRFFTVYGPWGRPDMAIFKFVKNILSKKPIDVFNYGNMKRDFTYIDDIIDACICVIDKKSKLSLNNYFSIFNIGKGSPTKLLKLISTIENQLKIKAKKKLLPISQGDMAITFCDTTKFYNKYKFKAKIGIEEGISNFINWYLSYYK